MALELKVTNLPSAEMAGSRHLRCAGRPLAPLDRQTKVVLANRRSRTKTFFTRLSSSLERLSASDSKATYRLLPERDGRNESEWAGSPLRPEARLTRIAPTPAWLAPHAA